MASGVAMLSRDDLGMKRNGAYVVIIPVIMRQIGQQPNIANI